MTLTDSSDSLRAALAPRYTLERELGRGGMATVYLARDLVLHRLVALKVLRPELAASMGRARFLREIDIAGRLIHPHILTLHDSGEVDGRLFYTMPYVEGESLRRRLDREGQLAVSEVIEIIEAVAGALTHAHREGVVHRDVKPENILLAQIGHGLHPLVADFGIATALDAASGGRLTETGLALGTPSYMSPEQAAGNRRLDGRSDIYALGCVAYEMLAGMPPFTGPSSQAILARHAVDHVPPLHTVRTTVPPAVEAAIERALAKVPADRFATAGEFVAAMVDATLPPVRRHRSAVLGRRGAFGFVAIATSAAAVAWLMLGVAPKVVPAAATIAVLPFLPATADSELARLGRDLAITVSATLDGVGGIQTADRLRIAAAAGDRSARSAENAIALGRRLGARSVARGTLVRDGDRVRADVAVFPTDGGAPLAAGVTVTAHPDSIAVLTDSIVWLLLGQLWRRGVPPSPSLAAVTTRSLPALRAFLEGERELEANQWGMAALAYRSAIEADSAFWLAHFRYALAQRWLEEPFEPEVLEALGEHREAFPERERLLVDAFLTRSDSLGLRLRRYRLVTQQFPDYWPGWFLYADLLHHGGTMIGYDWSEAFEGFRHVVALNPRMVPAWEHIFQMNLGINEVEAASAYARLTELGAQTPYAALLTEVARADSGVPPALEQAASSMTQVLESPDGQGYFLRTGNLGVGLMRFGFPAAQLELNNRLLESGNIPPHLAASLRATNAWAWAMRGQWDSALTLLEEVAADRPGVIGPPRYSPPVHAPVGGPVVAIESYAVAVLGAWLGATAPALADSRRLAAAAVIPALEDEQSRRDARGRLAWLDGLLGFVRRDPGAIRGARREALRSGYYQGNVVDRSLAAFERALAGDLGRAGRELAQVEEDCAYRSGLGADAGSESCNSFTPNIAVQRLAAAEWLLQAGEVERARRLLRWQDAASMTWSSVQWTIVYALGPTYLARARLEAAAGSSRIAGKYYRQFLRRYDVPMVSQVYLVEEAEAALRRLETGS